MNRTVAVLALFAVLSPSRTVSALQAASTPDDLTIKVQSQLVQIYVSVTEGTRRVTELAPSDFSVKEDGNPRAIERLDNATMPLQVALLLDTSGSMGPTLAATQEAALTFVASLQREDRVSFIPFSSDVRLIPQLTDDRTPVVSAIRAAQAHGTTKLYDALLFAMKHLARVQGRRAIVVFSDGEDTARTSSLDLVLNAAARHGFPIYTIVVRESLRNDQLKNILRQLAQVNRGRMFVVEDPRDLTAAFAEVATELRSIFVVNYYTDVQHDGRWHDVTVSVANPRMQVHCRNGFFARTGNAAAPESLDGPKMPALDVARVEHDAAAQAAADELASPSVIRRLEVKPLGIARTEDRDSAETKPPLFRIETRFVEVPVLVETQADRESPMLNQKDFRIYEDNQLREVAFFSKDVGFGSLAEPRARALSKLSGRPGVNGPVTAATDTPDLKLGRYYLVLDDMLTPAGAFLQVKRAGETIVRQFQDPLRPLSLHVLSEATAVIAQKPDPERMIEKIRKLVPRVPPALTSNDRLVSVYEAMLIDRGDREAQQLAELRYAASINALYRNNLGEVDGQPGTPAEVIQMGVANLVRQMLSENLAQLTRALDGLRAVLNAASADPGNYPKDVILLSSGFTLGRASRRSDLSSMLQNAIAEAKRGGARVHAIDASGLENDEVLGLGADGGFLVRNPQLGSMLLNHARGWRLDRQEPLSQLASETGGRFLHSTNDLVAGVNKLIGTRGRMYYLGFLSQQPADGRFHAVRVTVSDAGARVHSRKGYFAGASRAAENTEESAGEDTPALLARVRQAQDAGDMNGLVAALEPLARRFPGNVELWHALGVAHLKLGDYQRAVEALQRAFALAPGNPGIGTTLARALVAAGYRPAAVQILQMLARQQPHDIGLLTDLGRVYESDARIDVAYQVYRHILDLTFTPPLEVYLLLARTSAQLGRLVEARIFLDDYLSLGGQDTAVAQWRALLH